MKNNKILFIKKTTIFVLILLMLIILINNFYINSILSKTVLSYQEEDYNHFISTLKEKKIDFIFSGDSHTTNAINPKFIPNSFNLATAGESYISTYCKLNRILNKDKTDIKNLILILEPNSFYSTKNENGDNLIKNLWLYSKFTSYNEIKKIRKEDSIISLWIESNFPFIGKGDDFLILITNLSKPITYRGWYKESGDLSKLNKTDEAEKRYKEQFKWGEENEIQKEYFMKILNLTKKENIKIIFIRYPISREYDKIIQQNINEKEFYENTFGDIKGILGENYYFLDYKNFFFDKDNYFYDPDHLNYQGAEIFSKKVYEDFKNLNLSKKEEKNIILLENENLKSIKTNEKENKLIILLLIFTLSELILLILLLKIKD